MTTKPLTVDGVDLSHYQTQTLDLMAAQKAGVRFVYHKATEGTHLIDLAYTNRRAEVAKAGIPFGAYHFARPARNSAATEAHNFLAEASVAAGDMVPMLDLEDDGKLDRAALTAWVAKWVQIVLTATKAQPIIYTPFDLDRTLGSQLWVARYSDSNAEPHTPKPWPSYAVRQFSNGVYGVPNTVKGIGAVDLDHLADGVTITDLRLPPRSTGPDKTNTETRTGLFRIITQNVRALPLMSEQFVEHDVDLTAHQAGIVGWQEIDVPRYRTALAELGPRWATYYGEDQPESAGAPADVPGWHDSPISFRDDYWQFLDGGRRLLTHGKAKIAGDRYGTWLRLKHHETGLELIVANAHLVANPFGRPAPADVADRQRLWHQGKDGLLAIVDEQMTAHQSAAVAITIDANAKRGRDVKAFGDLKVGGRTMQPCTDEKSIDQLFVVNSHDGTVRWDDLTHETMPGRHSDHQGRRVRGRLEKVVPTPPE